ncbi:hypothetical protein BOX15_Mlig020288g1, partial [Macrostomum lignano]
GTMRTAEQCTRGLILLNLESLINRYGSHAGTQANASIGSELGPLGALLLRLYIISEAQQAVEIRCAESSAAISRAGTMSERESAAAKAPNRCLLVLKTLLRHRAVIATFLVPLALLPLIFYVGTKEAKAAFVIITMSFYWNFEVVPLGITALLPVVLVPALGIMPSRDICPAYFKDSNMLFLGGLILAVSIEIWDLHKRVALKVLLLCGVQPRWLLFGFLIPTWILSMWISNTATVAMMLPIAEAVLVELRKHYQAAHSRHSHQRRHSNALDVETAAKMSEGRRDFEGGAVETGAVNPAFEMSAASSSSDQTTVASGIGNHDAGCGDKDFAPESDVEGQTAKELDDDEIVAEDRHVDAEIDSAHDVDMRVPMKEFIADKRNAEFANICRMLMLSVSYGAVFGGVATLTGTAPNVILNGIVAEYFGSETSLNYSSWLFYGLPLAVVTLLIAWVWLQISFLGFRSFVRPNTLPKSDEERIKATLRREYQKLGPISYAEVNVILLFVLTICLWISREPGVRGWSALFLGPDPKNTSNTMSFTSDAQPVILSAILLFFLPSKNPFSCCTCKCPQRCGKSSSRRRRRTYSREVTVEPNLIVQIDDRPDRMMTWRLMQERVAWNIVLMLGAGFALADTSRVSGLSDWIGQQLLHLKVVPLEALIFIFCLFSALLTEWTSNGTAATILLPILASFSQNIGVHPFYLMLSSTASCSFAFILPISTPANILVFSRGYLRAVDMLRTGVVMWLLSNSLVAVATISYAPAIFGLRELPPWAVRNVTASATA